MPQVSQATYDRFVAERDSRAVEITSYESSRVTAEAAHADLVAIIATLTVAP